MEFSSNAFYNIKTEGGMGGWPVASTPPHTDKTKVNPFMQWAVINSIQGFYFTGPQQQGSGAGPSPPSDLPGRNSRMMNTSRYLSSVETSKQSKQILLKAVSDFKYVEYRFYFLFVPSLFRFSFCFVHTFLFIILFYLPEHGPSRSGLLTPLVSGGSESSTPGPAPTSKEDGQARPVTVTATGDSSRQVQTMAPAHYNHTTLHPMLPVDPSHHHHQQQQQPPQHHQQHQHQQPQQQAGEIGNQGNLPANHGPTNDTAFPGGHHRQGYSLPPGSQGTTGMVQQHGSNNIKSHLPPDKAATLSETLTKNKLYTEENGQVWTEMVVLWVSK